MDGVADEKTLFEWIVRPCGRHLFLLVDRQYVEARVVEEEYPDEAMWHVGTCSGTARGWEAAVDEVMSRLLPPMSRVEREDRWSIHDARWPENLDAPVLRMEVPSIKVEGGALVLAKIDRTPERFEWSTINTSLPGGGELLTGEAPILLGAMARAELALFEPAAYMESLTIDTTEVDQEQLRRTAEALSWVEEPEEGEILLRREGGVSGEDWDPSGFDAGDIVKMDTAKMTIGGKDVPISNLRYAAHHQTGSAAKQTVRPFLGVALHDAKAGEPLAIATYGKGFASATPANPPNSYNARCSVPHDLAIDQQGNVQITAKHPGTFRLQYEHHRTTPGWPIPTDCKPTGSFDELVRREEALASRERVKAALREGKLATMEPQYLATALEAIDKMPLKGPDAMPLVVESTPKGPFLADRISGEAYERVMREAEEGISRLVLGPGEDDE